jgi:hypothetical protein
MVSWQLARRYMHACIHAYIHTQVPKEDDVLAVIGLQVRGGGHGAATALFVVQRAALRKRFEPGQRGLGALMDRSHDPGMRLSRCLRPCVYVCSLRVYVCMSLAVCRPAY